MKAFSDMINYKPLIHDWICEHRQEIVSTLMDLVKIPSFRGDAAPGTPFGKDCAAMLEAVENLYHKHGFETIADREGGYLLAFCGEGEKSLGLFAHGDVVAPGEYWQYTEPFVPVEKEGFLIGRGVLDDKSAIVISLCCVRMLRELDLPFASGLVCYTGFNEESGMQDIRNYCAAHTPPDFALVCDTAFPLYRGNKGILNVQVVSGEPFYDILDFSGGEACNISLGKATAALRYSEKLYMWLKERETDGLHIQKQEEAIHLQAVGISRHAALPDGSINAGGMIAALLAECPYLSEIDRKTLAFASDVLHDYYGTALGIRHENQLFGPLTCVNGIIRTKQGKLALDFNIRFGNTVTTNELKNSITEVLTETGWNAVFGREENAHLLAEDHPCVQACLEAYCTYTGTQSARTNINAGGTYSMHLPCAVEIGTMFRKTVPFPLLPGHGQVHQPDECISIEGLLNAMELTMLMLIACDRE